MIAPEGPRGPRGAIEGAAAASRRAPALGYGPAGAARAPPRSRQHQCYQGAVYCRTRDFWLDATTSRRGGHGVGVGPGLYRPKGMTSGLRWPSQRALALGSARFVKCSPCAVLALCAGACLLYVLLASVGPGRTEYGK